VVQTSTSIGRRVAPDEGLAFISDVMQAPHLFLPLSAKRHERPGASAKSERALHRDDLGLFANAARNAAVKEGARACRAHWHRADGFPGRLGTERNTGRIADISPGLMVDDLGITTDEEVEVTFPYQNELA
jgi:hypothetical protein